MTAPAGLGLQSNRPPVTPLSFFQFSSTLLATSLSSLHLLGRQYAFVCVFAGCSHRALGDWTGFQAHSACYTPDCSNPIPKYMAWRRQDLAVEQMAYVLDR